MKKCESKNLNVTSFVVFHPQRMTGPLLLSQTSSTTTCLSLPPI